MTNSQPPERPSPRTQPLKKDEKIALLVAFATLGSIFFWGLNRATPEFDLAKADSWKNLTSPGNLKFPSVLQPGEEGEGIALLDPDRDRASEETDSESAILEPEAETADGDIPLETLAPIAPIVPALGLLDGTDEATPDAATPDATDTPDEVATPINEEEETAVVPDGDAQTPTAPATTPEVTPEPPAPETQINPDLPEPEEPIEFSDVPPDYWAFPFISILSSRQVIAGFPDEGNLTAFQPDSPISRAQLAVQLEKIFDLQDKQPKLDFQDITQDFWAAGAIEESNKANFLNGYPGGVFRPNQTIPRLELLVALATGLGLPLPENPDAVLEVYQDSDRVPEWAKPKIAAATQAGLVAAYPDRRLLELDRNATRAEVVAMMYQALVLGGAAEPIESEYLVPATP